VSVEVSPLLDRIAGLYQPAHPKIRSHPILPRRVPGVESLATLTFLLKNPGDASRGLDTGIELDHEFVSIGIGELNFMPQVMYLS
jgi:hypothetical protein